MSSSVNVLCPNGRRVSVKIGNNAPLLQVLEQVCQKQGLDPEKHELKRGKATIDLSCPFRFSGLPNNTKLELIYIDKPHQTNHDVVLMVQTAEGSRVQGTFLSSVTLWEVLQHLKLDNVKDPAIIYMRQQVIGRERLMITSIKDLGVTSGRVSVRLVSMKISEETKCVENTGEKQDKGNRREMITESVKEKDKKETRIGHISSIQPLEEEEDVVKSKLRRHDDDDMPMYPALPFSIFPEDNPNLSLEPMEIETPEQSNLEQDEEVFIASVAKYIQQNWQPQVTQRQVSTERKIYEGSCDREPVIYNLDDASSTPVSEVPDEFFDVTINDVQKMHRDLKKQVKSLSDAPLQTQQMRDSRRNEHYNKTVIRVIFPDRWVLQGCFNTGESLKSLVKFVREHLAEPNIKFYLYTTPPKQVLKSARPNFAEAGFVPAANIYFGLDVDAGTLSLSGDEPVSPILSESSMKQYGEGILHAELIANKERSHPTTVTENMSLEDPTVVHSTTTTEKRGETSGNRSSSSSQRSVSSSGQTVPKWFKIGPK